MDINHVDEESGKRHKIQSVFSAFNNLFSDKGQSRKCFSSVINSVCDGGFSVGTGGNLLYCLKRFIRGLTSSHLYPQCASFAALTCFLKYELTSADQVLDILDAESKGNFSTSEQGALNAGYILTCGAIIQSGTFTSLSNDKKQAILTRFISTGKTKSYLSTVTQKFLIDLVLTICEDDFKNAVWPVCKKEIKTLGEPNFNNYYFLLVCHDKFPQVVDKFIKKIEDSFESFVEKTVSLLVNGHIRYEDSVYDRICQVLLVDKKLLLKLWTNCINSSSSESKSSSKDNIATILFYFILKNLKEEKLIPKLLIPKFIETLIIILTFNKAKKSKNNDIHVLARSALDLLVNTLINENVSHSVRFKTIEKLLFYPANMKFEKKTGTKCIQSLIMHLNESSLKELTDIHRNIVLGDLKKIVDREGNSEDWNNNEKQYALHMFVKFLNHPSVRSNKGWKLDQIKFLYDTGFIKNFKYHSIVQKCARDCFYKAIEVQMPNLENVLELLDDLVLHVNDKIENGIVELSESATRSWCKVYKTIQKLKSKDKLFTAVHLLMIHMGLQLFSDSKLAEFNIEELLKCYSRLKNMHKKKNGDGNEAEDLHWSEVTVDLMLSLLSRDNKLWRYVVCNLVFPQMVKHITSSALHQIIEVLNPQSRGKILNEQSDGSDAFEDDEDDDDDEEEEEEEDKDEEKSDSSLTESENDENITLNDQFRSAIKDALGMSAALTDQESVDMDEMDEAEERRLNERLAEAFKMFKPNTGRLSKKQTKEEKALMHFRFRVLDLIDIYLSNSPPLSGCLDLMFPLFNLLELSIKDLNQRPLEHRVDVILKKLSTLKKFADIENITQKVIRDHFEALLSLREMPSMVFIEMAPRISDCCAFLVRCSQATPNNEPEIPLVSNYVSLLENFFHSRDNKLPITLFQSVLRSSWQGNWKLIPILYDLLVDPTIKLFKKMKMIELLEIFYRNSKLHASGGEQICMELNSIENQFVSKFTDYLTDYEGKKVKTNEKMFLAFFTRIMSLINFANQSFKRHRSELKKQPQWKKLIYKMVEVNIVLTNKKSRRQLAALANLFGVKMPEVTAGANERRRTQSGSSVQQDGDVDEGEAAEEFAKKKKAARKLSPETMRMKKESRRLRDTMGSYGIDVVSFSSFDLRAIPEEEQDEGGSVEEQSKQKTKKRKLKDDANVNGGAVPMKRTLIDDKNQ